MRRRSTAIHLLVALLVVLAGCSATIQTTDEESGPETSALSNGGPDDGTAWNVTITRVVDGDTVEARFPNGEVDTLRLLGVDTPETSYDRVSPGEFEGIPDTTAGRDHLYDWGERATVFATEALEGKTVRIAVDPAADRRGGYGRLLVYVYTEDGNFNERLLTDGYARLYESSFTLESEFAAAEQTAREEERGLWAFDEVEEATTQNAVATPSSPHMSSASETPRIAAHFGHS
ncbi:MAG: thermonuclease family protein [Halanaeroarchaeum sp.]